MHTRPECDDLCQSYLELQRLRTLVEQAEKRLAIDRCGRLLEAGRSDKESRVKQALPLQ